MNKKNIKILSEIIGVCIIFVLISIAINYHKETPAHPYIWTGKDWMKATDKGRLVFAYAMVSELDKGKIDSSALALEAVELKNSIDSFLKHSPNKDTTELSEIILNFIKIDTASLNK
jgi:hypothetical protein